MNTKTHHGQRVCRTGVHVDVRVGGRQDKDNGSSVDDVRQDLDTRDVDGDNERRGVGVGRRLVCSQK
jgi:hypothetical protein